MIAFFFACLITTAIIVGVVVIPYPTEITSYLALSFALVLDALWLYLVIPSRKRKYAKTVSRPLVFWLLIVMYVGFLASGFLANGYISAAKPTAKTVLLVFGCIFAAIGLAAVVTLIVMLVQHFIIKHCLKHGEEGVAEFVNVGDFSVFEYGKPQTNSHRTVLSYSVVFNYSANGEEKTAKSKRVFSEKEVELLKSMQTFKIKFDKRLAVISEILNAYGADTKQDG